MTMLKVYLEELIIGGSRFSGKTTHNASYEIKAWYSLTRSLHFTDYYVRREDKADGKWRETDRDNLLGEI